MLVVRSPTAAIALVCLLGLTGCIPSNAPTPTAAPTPSGTPSFDFDVEAEASLLASREPGEWIVVGVARAETADVQGPRLSIILSDAAGAELARRTVEIPPNPLPAAALWPFRESFHLSSTPASVQARLQGNAGNRSEQPAVQGRILRTFLDAQGQAVALGSLSNLASRPARVEHVRLVGRGANGSIREVLDARPAKAQIESGEAVPFLAPLPPGGEDLDWETTSIAGFGDGSRPAIEIQDVRPSEDSQGHPFVTAVLHNSSEDPRWASLTGIVLQGGTWLAGDAFDLPIVMAPGERAAVSIRVPGLGLPQEAKIEWLLVTDSAPADRGPIPVVSEVIDYQPLGSTLLLRVRLTAGRLAVRSPAVEASLIGDDGHVVSAVWGGGPPILAPGESTVVPLALPVPRAFDLTQGQLDVRAAGLP